MNTNELPRGWRRDELGNICNLTIGKTPSRKRVDYWMNGNYPWATISDLAHGGIVAQTKEYITQKAVEETNIPLIPTGTILLSFKLSIGKVAFAGTDLYTNEAVVAIEPKSEQLLLRDYLFFYLQELDIVGRARQAVKGKTVNKTILKRLPVVLPPLPVQERIVEILQKADEIRRKRKEALELADKILPSLFVEMFGDPATNPKGYEKTTIGKVASMVTSGYTPRGGARNYVADGPLLLRSQNIRMLSFDLSDCAHLPKSIFNEMERVHVQPGDVLMNITGKGTAGRVTWVDDPDLKAAVNQHVCIIRCRQDRILAPFLAITLSMPYYQSIIDRAPGSTQTGFNHSRVRALEIIVPPMPVQSSFVAQVAALQEVIQKHRTGCQDAERTFASLLSRAFTGELTAEWEAENAEWIAKRQSFYERLPQLVLLAFLVEKARRAGRRSVEAAVFVTALMKYAFLLQMEGNGRRRLYNFVPYHYGPFTKTLYRDLKTLHESGLIYLKGLENRKKWTQGFELPMVAEERVSYRHNKTGELENRRVEIGLADYTKAQKALAELPDDLKEDISAVLDVYGDLDHNTLIKTVYEKYPAYAKKSRLRKGVSPKGRSRGRRAKK